MSELVPLLNVEDVSTSIGFYQKLLDASEVNRWEDEGRVRWARIAFDGGSLMLNTPDRVDSKERRRRADFDDIVLYVMCEDAVARHDRLVAAGLDVGELHHEAYGNDEFGVRDPDGYAIRFSSPHA